MADGSLGGLGLDEGSDARAGCDLDVEAEADPEGCDWDLGAGADCSLDYDDLDYSRLDDDLSQEGSLDALPNARLGRGLRLAERLF